MDPMASPQAALCTLQLTGSTTLLARMQQAAEIYMGGHAARIVVNGGCGTARGYKALLDGTTDIAMASGAPADDITAALQARRLALQATVVAEDAIVPVTHPSNPVSRLSLQQLGHIYTGRIVNWRQVGGHDAAIDVLLGPPAGGLSISWRRAILGLSDTFTPQAQVMAMTTRLARVAVHPHAIAYVADMALPAHRVKALWIDGIAAGRLRAPMTLVTLEGAASSAAAAATFIAWTAKSGAAAGPGRTHE